MIAKTKTFKKGVSRLTCALVVFIFFSLSLITISFIFKNIKSLDNISNFQLQDLFSIENIKNFFSTSKKSLVDAQNVTKLKTLLQNEENIDLTNSNDEILNNDDNNIKDNISDSLEKIKSFSKNNDNSNLITLSGNNNDSSNIKYDEIVLRNNDVLTGEILNERLNFSTQHGKVRFKFNDIITIYCVYEAAQPYDKVITKFGDNIQGKIIDSIIRLKTNSDDTLEILVSNVKIIKKRINNQK